MFSTGKCRWAIGSLIPGLLMGCGGGSGTTTGTGGSGNPPPSLTLSVSPSSPVVYPSSTFTLTVTASESGTTAAPSLTLGTLPAGITTNASLPMSIPATGATINFSVGASAAAGNYAIPMKATAGSASAALAASVTIGSGTQYPGSFGVINPDEVQVTQGGSVTVPMNIQGSSLFDVSLSVTGLPAGASVTFSPQVVQPGQSFTMTLSASNSAPLAQNAEISVVGTPSANVSDAQENLILDVTAPDSVGWDNRTDYVALRGTPFGAVYDSVHQLIFSSNWNWNEVDVTSDQTHSLLARLPIRDPRGLDISPDGSTVWVATGSQVMYGINTATLKVTTYLLPRYGASSTSAGNSWEGSEVFALADGTIMLQFGFTTGGVGADAIWDPKTNALTPLLGGSGIWYPAIRSGDGTRVIGCGGAGCSAYLVASQTLTSPVQNVTGIVAVNWDGSKVAANNGTEFGLFDGNLNWIGPVPGDGGNSVAPYDGFIFGGAVFSQDGTRLYEETAVNDIPMIITVDVATQQMISLAPAMPVIPVSAQVAMGKFNWYVPAPFAVDANGLLLGVQYLGIAFDDPAAITNFVTNEPGTPIYAVPMSPFSGPVAGGTTSTFPGSSAATTDVYYGSQKGTVTDSGLEATSPPAAEAGPINLKVLFPDGREIFDPEFFTYGTQIQDVVLSGGSPSGGVPGQLDAFGLPLDPSKDTVTIGGNQATVTSTITQYPPFTPEQTAMYLNYTVPAGAPGWADVTVQTPNGSGTLPKSFFYAKSVTDYSSKDTFTYLLYDASRNQLYLSAGNHIDVFSLASDSFTTSIQPPAVGTTSQFQGLALTPDGKYLLAANLLDGSLAVIDPDTPADSYVIPVAKGSPIYPTCTAGPLIVAADNQGQAFVINGAAPAVGCGAGGSVYVANLAAKTATLGSFSGCGQTGGWTSAYAAATADGSTVAFGGGSSSGGFELFNAAQQQCVPVATPAQPYGIAAAADGNTFGVLRAFTDASGNILGRMAMPPVLYFPVSGVYYNLSPYGNGALGTPKLNDSGSLYYWAYPNYVDIVDVQHGLARLRFSLSETISNTVDPIAIDSGGRRIFLITNAGLTVVDLGEAPLSIGHLSQTTASAGAQVTVRGSGFENGIEVTVGGQAAATTWTDENTLTFLVPAAATGPQDVELQNPDGTSYTLSSGIVIQ